MLADPNGIGEINMGEERLCKTVLATYKVAVEESAMENAPPPIHLGDLTPETLRQILSGET